MSVLHRDDVNSHWYPVLGDLGMPVLRGVAPEDPLPETWRFFPHAGPGIGTHFFLPDERFERVWRRPDVYARRLVDAGTDVVCSPDFSCWREMPEPVLQFQTYRNRWVGALWESYGLRVVPTVCWSARTDAFFFDGLPRHSTLAIGTIGLKDREGRDAFARGIEAMEEALRPRRLLVYGNMEFESRAEIVRVKYEHWWHDYERHQETTWYDRNDAGEARVRRTKERT